MSIRNILMGNYSQSDPYYNNVVLLLTGDDLIDRSLQKNTITNYGSVISTSTKKYGTGSIYFNGSSYISMPGNSGFAFGTGNFTIEFWLNFTSTNGSWSGGFITTWHIGGANSGNGWSIGPNNNASYDIAFGGMWDASSNYIMGGVPLTNYIGNWIHYAIVRNGSTLTQYFNGTSYNTYNVGTQSIYYPNTDVWLGAWGSGYGGTIGYMDDIRITKGIARYNSNFTPPDKLPLI